MESGKSTIEINVQAAKAEFHAHLASNKSQQQSSYELVEDSELLSEDRELDSDNQGMYIQGLPTHNGLQNYQKASLGRF